MRPLSVGLALVWCVAAPVAAAPMLGPVTAVDAPVNGPINDYQNEVAAARAPGGQYLVAWRDGRLNTQYDIYAARVSAAGQVLDIGGIPISTDTGLLSESPSVVWNGTNYLVTWSDNRLGGFVFEVLAKRVALDGRVVDTAPIVVSPGSARSARAVASPNSTDTLVVYSDLSVPSGTDDIRATRIAASGAVLDPSGIAVCTAIGLQYGPAVAAQTDGYLIAWTDQGTGANEVWGARMTLTGTVRDPFGTRLATGFGALNPSLTAVGGTDYVAAWQQQTADGGMDIYARRVTSAFAASAPVVVTAAPFNQVLPTVAWNGVNVGVLWLDSRRFGTPQNDLYFARLDAAAGAVLDPLGIELAQQLGNPLRAGLVPTGADFLPVWSKSNGGLYNDEAFAMQLSGSGTPLSAPFLVATKPAVETRPSLAFDGTRHFAVWVDNRDNFDAPRVYGLRLDANGTPLDATALAFPMAPYGTLSSPRVAGDGTTFLVVWSDARSGTEAVYAARVAAATGLLLDAAPLVISSGAGARTDPAVTWAAGNFVVTWADARNNAVTGADIYATRVTAAGGVLDSAGVAVTTAAGAQRTPAIAHDGTSFVAAWADARSVPTTVYATRLGATLTVLDVGGVPMPNPGASTQGAPTVASVAGQSLVAWAQGTNVLAARFSSAGAVLDAAPLSLVMTPNASQQSPTATVAGGLYVVAWVDGRAGNPDAYAARVDPAGVVLDPDGFVISAAAERENAVALAGQPGQCLAAYAHGATYEDSRVVTRRVSFGPSAPVILLPTQGATTGPQPDIFGSTELGARVTVFIDGVDAGTAALSTDAGFLVSVPAPLSLGAHAATAVAAEASGLLGPTSSVVTFTVSASAGGGQGGGSGGASGGGAGGASGGGAGGGGTPTIPLGDGGFEAALHCGGPWAFDTGWPSATVTGAPVGVMMTSGVLSWTPTRYDVGAYTLTVADSASSQRTTVTLEVTCHPPQYTVGCGCGAGGPPLALLLVLLLKRARWPDPPGRERSRRGRSKKLVQRV